MRLKTVGHAYDLDSKVSEAKAIVDSFLPAVKEPLLAFSGGKDSIVLCHLLATHYGVKDAVCANSYWFARTDADVRTKVVPSLGIHVTYWDRLGAFWIFQRANRKYIWPTDSRVFGQFYSLCQQSTVKRHAIGNGYDAVLYGRRKQENVVVASTYRTVDGLNNCFPLYSWRHEHVWTYIRRYDLPVPSIYEYELGAKEGCTSWNMIDPKQYRQTPQQLIEDFCPITWNKIKDRL